MDPTHGVTEIGPDLYRLSIYVPDLTCSSITS